MQCVNDEAFEYTDYVIIILSFYLALNSRMGWMNMEYMDLCAYATATGLEMKVEVYKILMKSITEPWWVCILCIRCCHSFPEALALTSMLN